MKQKSGKKKTMPAVLITVLLIVAAVAAVIIWEPWKGKTEETEETRQTKEDTGSMPPEESAGGTAGSRPEESGQEPEAGDISQTSEPQSPDTAPVEVTETDTVLRFDMGTAILTDMDGDGVKEEVQVYYPKSQEAEGDNGREEYSIPNLRVNDKVYTPEDISNSLKAYMVNPSPTEYFLLDLDTGDHCRELAVFDQGPSGDPETFLFQWNGTELVFAGSFPDYPVPDKDNGLPVISGDGTVESAARLGVLQTWAAPGLWRLDQDGILKEAPLESYEPFAREEAAAAVSLLRDIEIYSEKDINSRTVSLKAGEEVAFLKVAFEPEGVTSRMSLEGQFDGAWIQISGSSKGWIYMKDFNTLVLPDGEFLSTIIFENLNFAG